MCFVVTTKVSEELNIKLPAYMHIKPRSHTLRRRTSTHSCASTYVDVRWLCGTVHVGLDYMKIICKYPNKMADDTTPTNVSYFRFQF